MFQRPSTKPTWFHPISHLLSTANGQGAVRDTSEQRRSKLTRLVSRRPRSRVFHFSYLQWAGVGTGPRTGLGASFRGMAARQSRSLSKDATIQTQVKAFGWKLPWHWAAPVGTAERRSTCFRPVAPQARPCCPVKAEAWPMADFDGCSRSRPSWGRALGVFSLSAGQRKSAENSGRSAA
ncbi:hypothetical protein BDP81DRAFT_92417 [Colletotrichum phormii]|uniref:Uncharacterized protein n=1 Tax=Colletotrichum phormii TaxID=359342 RepID=A0AAJ0EJ76_9PEZI|nr:uncharacterized protein BDP81DRAFT_92417 [Colletotrichum phormii]KAK1654990.1 hypothetical protein BDP81DRAFT_92417 [Colletotrichum phormii]